MTSPTEAATRGGTVLKASLLVIHSLVFKVKIRGSRYSVGNTSRAHSHTINRRIGHRRMVYKCTDNLVLVLVHDKTSFYPCQHCTMSYSYPFYQILTILGMVLLLMATPFHLNMKGSSTWPFIFWLFIWCILATVGSIVWRDRMEIISPTWCDICASLWSPLQRFSS